MTSSKYILTICNNIVINQFNQSISVQFDLFPPLFSSDQMKDDYLTRRFSNAELAANIVAHYKRLPTLSMLARQPFVCWMVATVFERCFHYQGYGVHPPRLTPFYVNILIVQTNRKLQFYCGKAENDLVMSISLCFCVL